jgi:hypothetical protein
MEKQQSRPNRPRRLRPRRLRAVHLAAALLAVCGPCATRPAGAAVDLRGPDGSSLQLSALLQPTAQVTGGAAAGLPSGDAATDLYLRRIRLIASGTLLARTGFVFSVDQPRYGRRGDYSAQLALLDAYAWVDLGGRQLIEAGQLQLPFARGLLTGAGAIHTLDNASPLISFFGADHNNRELGVQYRGLFAAEHLQLRLGLFNGVAAAPAQAASGTQAAAPALNPDGRPAVYGRVHYSLLGSETGLTYQGIAFAEAPIVTVGAGGSWQGGAGAAAGARVDLSSYAADAHAELPLFADGGLLADAAAFLYLAGSGSPAGGAGYSATVGLRFGAVEPLVTYERFDSDDAAGTRSLRALRGGLNLWLRRHQLNLKAELAAVRQGRVGAASPDPVFTAQLQLAY